ncbi:MAG TPA: hypothetical protein PLH57_08665, partial [Oligoflexia bacterium]|nr:hypothetical protein [Oligoflexia bacterium]
SKSPSFEASRSLLKIVEMRFLNRFEGRSQRPEILQKQKPICRLQFELANRKETLDVYSDASGGLWVRNTNLPNVQFEVKKELVTKVDSLKAVPATQ